MIGVPIYLVSACGSGAEFIAAFRRYADKQGIFVPIAEPFPVGRRGRIALTLKDGGVMIEGEAEVVVSSRSPSALYGRVGMTLRFVEPDDASKTVIGALEKARLAMKAPDGSGAVARPAAVPAEPRPIAPTPGGRIDAANALAESVAIGDLGGLREVAVPPKAGAKFVLPSIPTTGATRSSDSKPPPYASRGKGTLPPSAAAPPIVAPAASVHAAPPAPAIAPAPSVNAVPPAITAPAPSINVAPLAPAPIPAPTPMLARPTPIPLAIAPAPPIIATASVEPASRPREDPTTPDAAVAARDVLATTQRGTGASALVKPALPPPRRSSATTPPVAIVPSPPIVAASPAPAAVEIAEPTDLGTVPVAPRTAEVAVPEPRKTTLGVAVAIEFVEPARDTSVSDAMIPAIVGSLDVDPHGATLRPDAMMVFSPPPRDAPTPTPTSPTIEEATPSGDWTMTPDGVVATPRSIPPGQQSGDWTIARDAAAPDGWASPEKVVRPARPAGKGPRITSVASTEPLELKATWEPESTNMTMAKVEVDPTLMEPLVPFPIEPSIDERSAAPSIDEPPRRPSTLPMPLPVPIAVPLPLHDAAALFSQPPLPGYVTPLPGQLAMPSVAFDPDQHMAMLGFAPAPRPATEGGAVLFHDAAQDPRDSTSLLEIGRRRRVLVIVMSAALVAALGIVLVVTLGGGKKHDEPAIARPDGSGSAIAPALPLGKPIDAGPAVVAVADAAIGADAALAAVVPLVPEPTPTPVDAAAEPACFVDVTTVPAGAEIAIDTHTVIGTSPAKLALPCAAPIKLYIRRSTYGGVIKSVTPTVDGTKLRVALIHLPMLVKVSSTPAGATITANGKAMGTTPTTIKLPAFAAATIVISKDGFVSDTQTVTPKQDKQAIHAQLKKSLKRH